MCVQSKMELFWSLSPGTHVNCKHDYSRGNAGYILGGGGGGGVVVAPNIAQHTALIKFLGRNQLGKLLHLIRSEVQESADKDGSPYNGLIFTKPSTHENSDVPLLSNSALEDLLTTPPCEVTKKHDLLENKVQQQDSLHLQTKTNKMTVLNDSIDAYSQQLTSSHVHVLHPDLAQNRKKMWSNGNYGCLYVCDT